MPVHRVLIIGAISFMAIRFPAPAESAGIACDTPDAAVPMIIIAETDGPDSGTVRFALFDRHRADCWNDSVLMAVELPVRGCQIVWKTVPLPDGAYALAIFHDLNGNDELDKNIIGKPKEPYGFSNDARHLIGPPSIKEATFRFDKTSRSAVVKLR